MCYLVSLFRPLQKTEYVRVGNVVFVNVDSVDSVSNIVVVVVVVIVKVTLLLLWRSFLFVDFRKKLLHHLFHIVVIGRR